MSYQIQEFKVNDTSAYLTGVDFTLDENKDTNQPASCKSVNKLFYSLNNKYIFIGQANYTQVSKKFGRVSSGETYKVYIHNTNLEYTEKDDDLTRFRVSAFDDNDTLLQDMISVPYKGNTLAPTYTFEITDENTSYIKIYIRMNENEAVPITIVNITDYHNINDINDNIKDIKNDLYVYDKKNVEPAVYTVRYNYSISRRSN